ncbi:hypothetical protein IAR55_001590 [Kwoniella newhampshirensis]|uniref:RraA-like protein n=1 Tax=Kwoniella newhampshirensis TaxID=1651941 RepID=A0AAW0Z2M2_9TREE
MRSEVRYGGLEELTTCEISDALIKLGIMTGGHIPDMNMYSPLDESTKVIGPAFTVKMVVWDDKDPPKPEDHFVDASPPGSIIIISAPFIRRAACWGGLMSTAAKARGVKGVIVQGGCRDLNEHRQIGFPVFAHYHSTLGQKTFVRPSQLNVPIRMDMIQQSSYPDPRAEGSSSIDGGGTVVEPGDIIVADLDGCVAIPRASVTDVVRVGMELKGVDERVREDLESGIAVKETMAKWRGS